MLGSCIPVGKWVLCGIVISLFDVHGISPVICVGFTDCVGLHIGNTEILATGEPSKTGFVVSFF